MANYSDKLKNPKWQKKRLEILNLRGFKCEKCGCEEKELHVHHRFYLKGREVWQYDNDVFQVLCCDCHEKEHKKDEKTIEVIPDNLKNLFSILQKFTDFEITNLLFFIENVNETNDLPEILNLLANSINSGWFDSLIQAFKDKQRIEDLEIKLFLLQKQLTEILPDLQ